MEGCHDGTAESSNSGLSGELTAVVGAFLSAASDGRLHNFGVATLGFGIVLTMVVILTILLFLRYPCQGCEARC